MSTSPVMAAMLGLFGLGGGEIILILALVLILLGAKKLPELARGLREGIWRFRNSMDDVAHDAGRSIGGIYGKPAAQAITADNQVAELYDPAVLRRVPEAPKKGKGLLDLLRKTWVRICSWFRTKTGG